VKSILTFNVHQEQGRQVKKVKGIFGGEARRGKENLQRGLEINNNKKEIKRIHRKNLWCKKKRNTQREKKKDKKKWELVTFLPLLLHE